MRCVQAVDKRKERGGDRGNQHTGGKASSEALPQKTAEQTAKVVGTSRSKVEKVLLIVDHATKTDPRPLQEVLSGRASIDPSSGSRRMDVAAKAGTIRDMM